MFEKIASWYFSRAAIPYWIVFAADCLMTFIGGIIAFAAYYSLSFTVANLGPLSLSLLAFSLCYMVGFKLFHTYTGVIRQTSVSDLARVGLALTTGASLIILIRILTPIDSILFPIKFNIILIQAFTATVLMGGMRIGVKLIYDIYLRHTGISGPYGCCDRDLIHMEMSDLLHRDPNTIDMDKIANALGGKRILVTGAAGSIGSELTRLLADLGPAHLVLVDQAETPLHTVRIEMERLYPHVRCETIVTSICHGHRMREIFSQFRPQTVFHAAAYKHVPMMEDNPVESVLNNVDGTKKLADLAVEYGVEKFIMISTDKAVNPTNVMGCSKRLCEMYCQSLSGTEGTTQFITTRFGNVLGSNGSVIPTFREQIRRGGPVMVTHPKVIRYFMLISEACSLVLEAAVMGKGGEIFAFDMGAPVKIVDLARRMIQLSGRLNIGIRFTGLRPGEKLYEEVLNDHEEVLPTRHRKINIAKVIAGDYHMTDRLIRRLIDTARGYDTEATVRMMKQIVPEYRSPADSQYAYLDHRPASVVIPMTSAFRVHPVAMKEREG